MPGPLGGGMRLRVQFASLLLIGSLSAERAMADQQILPPDLDRVAKQRAVVNAVVRDRYGAPLPGGKADLAILQRLVDEQAFRPDQTYELQSFGIVLGQVLAEHPDLSWVTVQDEYGEDLALRYKATSILVFPVTMISKRVEDGREVDVEYFYEMTLRRCRELESEAD